MKTKKCPNSERTFFSGEEQRTSGLEERTEETGEAATRSPSDAGSCSTDDRPSSLRLLLPATLASKLQRQAILGNFTCVRKSLIAKSPFVLNPCKECLQPISMLSIVRRARALQPLQYAALQLRSAGTDSGSNPRRRRSKFSPSAMLKKNEDKSDWWVVDGEMHEIGENVPPRERFMIPRENIPNKRRKKLREQFMRRTRLVLKESEHEPWCKRYMELYNELRENWERLYWNEGYSKKLGQDHANYDSAEDDDEDFNPYRRRRPQAELMKDQGFVRTGKDDTWEKVSQIRDKFEYDRERRMREKAFAPMNGGSNFGTSDSVSKNQPFDIKRYISESESD